MNTYGSTVTTPHIPLENGTRESQARIVVLLLPSKGLLFCMVGAGLFGEYYAYLESSLLHIPMEKSWRKVIQKRTR